jgi:hypothetical protein
LIDEIGFWEAQSMGEPVENASRLIVLSPIQQSTPRCLSGYLTALQCQARSNRTEIPRHSEECIEQRGI